MPLDPGGDSMTELSIDSEGTGIGTLTVTRPVVPDGDSRTRSGDDPDHPDRPDYPDRPDDPIGTESKRCSSSAPMEPASCTAMV
jgi:hypothetical protein